MPKTTSEDTKETHETNMRLDLLAQRLEEILPGAFVKAVGFAVVVFLRETTFTVLPVGGELYDLSSRDGEAEGQSYEGIPQERVEEILLVAAEKETPGSVVPKRPDRDDPPVNESGSLNEYKSADQVDVSAKRMLYHSPLASYLKEVLPLGPEDEVYLADEKIFLALGNVGVDIIPAVDGTFSVKTAIDGQEVTNTRGVTYGNVIRFCFQLANNIADARRDFAAESRDNPHPQETLPDYEEPSHEDAFSVLKELARETGQPDDLFRNKSLMDLRAGLVSERSAPKSDLLAGLDHHLRSFQALKSSPPKPTPEPSSGVKWFRGGPVALTTPKSLAYVAKLGAVLVEKQNIPPSDGMKLSWDPARGVVMVPQSEPTQRPYWLKP